MDGLMDSLIVGTTIICSFGTAFFVQKAALGLLLRAMDAKRS
jgi:branched-subunit amino acid ABC-type transport system permease component